MHSCAAIRVDVIVSACRIYFLKSLDLFLFIFLVIFFNFLAVFFFIDIFFLLSRIFASCGNKISSLHSSVHLTSFFFLFPCTFFFIIYPFLGQKNLPTFLCASSFSCNNTFSLARSSASCFSNIKTFCFSSMYFLFNSVSSTFPNASSALACEDNNWSSSKDCNNGYDKAF